VLFYNSFHHQANDESRRKMTEKWESMMGNSPYLVDQARKDDLRRQRQEESEQRKKDYRSKMDLLASMSGKASEKILTRENSQSMLPRQKLAVGLRQSLRDENVIKRERQLLDCILDQELHSIAQKFSSLPVLQEISRRELLLNDSLPEEVASTLESSESRQKHYHDQGEPQHQQQQQHSRSITSTNSTTMKEKKPNSKSRSSKRGTHTERSHDDVGNESSIFSGPLEYTNPATSMRKLEDEVSMEFALKNFESLDKLPV
jgi:hypothetical protein